MLLEEVPVAGRPSFWLAAGPEKPTSRVRAAPVTPPGPSLDAGGIQFDWAKAGIAISRERAVAVAGSIRMVSFLSVGPRKERTPRDRCCGRICPLNSR